MNIEKERSAFEAWFRDEIKTATISFEDALTGWQARAALDKRETINLNDKAVQKRLATQWGYVIKND